MTTMEAALAETHAEAFGWALACCHRDRFLAEEVLHVAYVKVLDGSARFDQRSSFKTFLFGVIRKTAMEQRRANWLSARQAALTGVAIVRTSRGTDLALAEAIAQAQSLSSWTAPTDEWLTLAGLEIPDSVPSLSLSSVTLPDELDDATSQGEAR